MTLQTSLSWAGASLPAERSWMMGQTPPACGATLPAPGVPASAACFRKGKAWVHFACINWKVVGNGAEQGMWRRVHVSLPHSLPCCLFTCFKPDSLLSVQPCGFCTSHLGWHTWRLFPRLLPLTASSARAGVLAAKGPNGAEALLGFYLAAKLCPVAGTKGGKKSWLGDC